jgi:hypothetical protein
MVTSVIAALTNGLTTSSPKALRKLFKSYGPLPYFGIAETGLGPRTIASDPGKLFMLKTAQIVADMLGVSTRRMLTDTVPSRKNGHLARHCQRAASLAKSMPWSFPESV